VAAQGVYVVAENLASDASMQHHHVGVFFCVLFSPGDMKAPDLLRDSNSAAMPLGMPNRSGSDSLWYSCV